jgi:hypothetical protein
MPVPASRLHGYAGDRTSSLAPARLALRVRLDMALVRRNLHAPSYRLHQRNRRAPARCAHVTTCPRPCSQHVKYKAPPRSVHPAPEAASVRTELPLFTRRMQLPRPTPISHFPHSYGCPIVSERDVTVEGGRRRDATPNVLLKHPNTVVATYV